MNVYASNPKKLAKALDSTNPLFIALNVQFKAIGGETEILAVIPHEDEMDLDEEEKEEENNDAEDNGRTSSRLSIRQSSRVKKDQKKESDIVELQNCDSFLAEFIPDDCALYAKMKSEEYQINTTTHGSISLSKYLQSLREILSFASRSNGKSL